MRHVINVNNEFEACQLFLYSSCREPTYRREWSDVTTQRGDGDALKTLL